MSGSNLAETIAHVVTALAAAAGAVFAAMGLTTWRRQLRGRNEYDLACRVLRCVYGLRDEINVIRNVFSQESTEAHYERVKRRASDLDASLFEARVLWGNQLDEPKAAMKECVDVLYENMLLRIDYQRKGAPLSDERLADVRRILDGKGRRDDDFGTKVSEAVAAFERILRRQIR